MRNRPSSTLSGGGGFYLAKPINPPAASGIVVGRSRPVARMERDKFVVCGTEIAGVVNTSSTFAAGVINCVPHSFPWLNGQAALYSKWRWRALRFIYVPTCPTSTQGQIGLSFQYDVIDTTPTSLSDMTMMNGFTNAPYWLGGDGAVMLSNPRSRPVAGAVVSSFDVSRQTLPWYPYITAQDFLDLLAVSTTGPAAANIYSPGNLVSASVGGPTVSVAGGNLYAQYEIEMIEPTVAALNK